ncbi:VOC family protein [Streptosporangium sp. NPDC002544]|uniref:VOC family protein n=1 Tax=Streptosporangium sp. NPDC002544 TaxID=3154538 RepID=UPI003321BE83
MNAALTGVHHLKIWVSDLERSRSWYERVLGLEHHTGFEAARLPERRQARRGRAERDPSRDRRKVPAGARGPGRDGARSCPCATW